MLRLFLLILALDIFAAPLAFAEDLRLNLQWEHSGQAENGSQIDIDYFRIGWDTKQGPPYENIELAQGYSTRGWAMNLLNRTPGEILYFSVQACSAGYCSEWAEEVAVMVHQDIELPTVRPSRPTNLILMINAPVLVVPSANSP